MIEALCPRFRRTAYWAGERFVVIGIALVMLMGALITPWGLAKSHGSAAFAVSAHEESREGNDGHGHSHEDDATVSSGSHAHHAGDHSHDNASALPVSLPVLIKPNLAWHQRPTDAGPSPSLDGLERPPRT